MRKTEINYAPIGIIESPHADPRQTPVQPVFATGVEGKVVLFEKYQDGLKDLEEFSHIYLFYHFNKTDRTELQLKPFLEDKIHGVFATRAPYRPNKLGMSLVRIKKIIGNTIYVSDLDVLNETPLIDIKPYVHRFDHRENVKSGWQDDVSDDEAGQRGKRDYKNS